MPVETVDVACPWCGHNEVIFGSEVYEGTINHEQHWASAGICNRCLCHGPFGHGATEDAAKANARELWNERVGV